MEHHHFPPVSTMIEKSHHHASMSTRLILITPVSHPNNARRSRLFVLGPTAETSGAMDEVGATTSGRQVDERKATREQPARQAINLEETSASTNNFCLSTCPRPFAVRNDKTCQPKDRYPLAVCRSSRPATLPPANPPSPMRRYHYIVLPEYDDVPCITMVHGMAATTDRALCRQCR